MPLRLTTLSLLLALAACTSSSQPAPEPRCNASTCEGCCREDGKCMAGSAPSVCGVGGAACQACGADQTCGQGRCIDTPAPAPDAGVSVCDNATSLGVLGASLEVEGSTRGAADDGVGPCGGDGSEDAVYAFSVEADGPVSVTVVPRDTSLRPVVYLRKGCQADSTSGGCMAAGMLGGGALVAGELTRGTWYVWVDGAPGTAGDYTLSIRSGRVAEDCAAGASLPLGPGGEANVRAWLTSYRNDSAGTCGGDASVDAVYRFTTTEVLDLSATLSQTSASTALYLRQTCGADERVCRAGAWGNAATTSLEANLLPPGTYYLWVEGASSTWSPTFLYATLRPPPAGEACVRPEPLALSGGDQGDAQVTGTLDGFRADVTLPCTGTAQADRYYAFTTTAPMDVRATVSPAAGSYASLALAEGSCGGGWKACTPAPGYGMPAELAAGALPPGTYHLVVSGTGQFVLSTTVTPPRPGDGCTQPGHLTLPTSGAVTVSGSTAGFFDDQAGRCGGSGGADVVYALTLSSAATVTAKVTPGAPGFQPVVSVRSGTCAGTEVTCAAAPAAGSATEVTAAGLAAGTHYLWVDGLGGTSGPFTLDVTVQ